MNRSASGLARDRIEAAAKNNAYSLELAGRRITELPAEVAQLSNLGIIDLRDNKLTQLPTEIGQLSNLKRLLLDGNRLTELPAEIGQLSNLTTLDLNGCQLAELPSEIGQLSNLKRLLLDGNRLTELPAEIGQLSNLRHLSLRGNQLTELPAEFPHLRNLRVLFIQGNELAQLPDRFSQLSSLRTLDLSDNELTKLPAALARLSNLRTLNLWRNQLTGLPDDFFQLSRLRTLDLSHNQLTKLPAEIAQLSRLGRLNLKGNKLTELPAELAQLPNLQYPDLSDNPLRSLVDEYARSGWEELREYLSSLLEGVPQYEAKVLLVGEGNVGKTSLLSALRNEDFQENRDTTHGLEIHPVEAEHPDAGVGENLRLNFWDFGGQEVYRITHQLFFSPDALYLVVWKPREGQREDRVEEWLETIRLRVGDRASVLLVSTHSNERRAEIDYPRLQDKYGSLLLGRAEIDSSDGAGISDLRRRIASWAASLKHVGTPVNRTWFEVRDHLFHLDDTHVSYGRFQAICAAHGLDDSAARSLIRLLHRLGHVVHYDSEGLRDFVVLKPEWIAKAIGYVLEDETTEAARGELDHRRLDAIWRSHGDPKREAYEPKHFPYFLRLMEQYDVSYRIEAEDKSLIGQLVPYERAAFEWSAPLSATNREVRLLLDTKVDPPGLLPWTIVRCHRWSTGQHWRSGVFLRHAGHEALVERVGVGKTRVVVRGGYPAHFRSLIQDALEYLIRDRWPTLDYRLLVECRDCIAQGLPDPGAFPLEFLQKAHGKGLPNVTCQSCVNEQPVTDLMLGLLPRTQPIEELLDERLRQVDEKLCAVQRATADRDRRTAQIAETLRAFRKSFLDPAREGPRLFSLFPDSQPRRLGRSVRNRYTLTLWCEHPGHEHPLSTGQYPLSNPADWLMGLAPYASVVAKVLRLVPLVSAGARLADEAVRHAIRQQLDFMRDLHDLDSELLVPEGDERLTGLASEGDFARADQSGIRVLHSLLHHVDKKRVWGGLARVQDEGGNFLWVCPDHYGQYDRGLPILPPSG